MNEQTQKIIKKHAIGIVSGLLAIVLGCLIYFRSQGLPQLEEDYKESSRTLDIVLRNETQGATLESDLAQLEGLMEKLDNRLMEINTKAQNYQFFYNIERYSRASIDSLDQRTAKPSNGIVRPKLKEFDAIDFDLRFSGRLFDMLNFLKRVEMGEYFVHFKSVKFSGDSAIAPDGLNAVLNLEILAKKSE